MHKRYERSFKIMVKIAENCREKEEKRKQKAFLYSDAKDKLVINSSKIYWKFILCTDIL